MLLIIYKKKNIVYRNKSPIQLIHLQFNEQADRCKHERAYPLRCQRCSAAYHPWCNSNNSSGVVRMGRGRQRCFVGRLRTKRHTWVSMRVLMVWWLWKSEWKKKEGKMMAVPANRRENGVVTCLCWSSLVEPLESLRIEVWIKKCFKKDKFSENLINVKSLKAIKIFNNSLDTLMTTCKIFIFLIPIFFTPAIGSLPNKCKNS